MSGGINMNKWLIYLSTFFLLLLGFMFSPRSAHADVYGTDSVLNGLITQQAINQTNKPQYADKSGNEQIDPVTGSLTLKTNQFSLPGRDGLDLNVGVFYQSNYAFAFMRNYNSPGNIKNYNYLISRYDLGQGWSFRFPSVQLADGYMYYHTGEGPVYRIDFSASGTADSYTHLIGYQGKDLQFKQDSQGSFTNGQASSAYYLEYASKKREYFAADGRLLGIVDRYGNTVTYLHQDRVTYDGQTNKVISSITDSIGRTITFTYDTNLQTATDAEFRGEKIVLTLKDQAGAFVQSVTYTKWRQNLLFNNNPIGKAPTLWTIEDQNNEYTYFTYSIQRGRFDYRYKSYDYSGYNDYSLLTKVEGNRSQTNYQFETINRNLGSSGLCEEFRIKNRNDQLWKNHVLSGDYNHLDYSYTNDYSGYPDYYNPSSLPASFTFLSKKILQSTSRSNGQVVISTYNGLKQSVSIESKAASGERKVTNYLAYHSLFSQLPTSIQQVDYGVGDTDATANKLFVNKTYTDWGALLSETKPLTQSQMNDATTKSKYTTTYSYEPVYYKLTSRSGYQNETTPYSELYTYDANGRLRSYTNPKGEVTTTWYETINAAGTATSNESNPSQLLSGKVQKVTTTKNLENGKKSQSVTKYLSETNYAYPSEALTVFTSTDATGQSVTQTMKKTMAYYMGTGLLKNEVEGNQNQTSYTYDAVGKITAIIYPDFTNSNGERYTVSDRYSYSYLLDDTSVTEDPENSGLHEMYVYSYRQYKRLSTGTITNINQQYLYYDGMGNVRKTKMYDPATSTWKEARNHYDDQGRVTYSRDVLGNVTTASYNEWGRQDEIIDSYGNLYKSENQLKARRYIQYFVAADKMIAYRANPTQNSNKMSYIEKDLNQWGQVITQRAYKDWPKTVQPVTEQFQYDIAGNTVASTDLNKNLNSDGVTKKYTYDLLNRIITVKDALNQLTNVEYNLSGNVRRVYKQSTVGATPAELSAKQYNEIGLVTIKTDPAGVNTTSSYDSFGQLVRSVDRNGSVTTNQYDEQHRVLNSSTTNNGIVQETKHIIGSNGIMFNTIQILQNGTNTASMTNGTDINGRMTTINMTNPGYTSALTLTYDANNRITRQYNGLSGFSTNVQYNQTRLDKVQVNGQSALDSTDNNNVRYSYYANGLVKTVSYPNLADGTLLKTENTYDSLNRLKTLVNSKGATTLSSYTYDYDNNGNITSIIEVVGGSSKTNTYSYDKLNRLETVTRSDGSSNVYTYDLQGNRTTQKMQGFLLLEDTSNTYDLYNRLTSLNKGGLTTTFSYGADGMRYKKSSGTQTIQYQYNLAGQVISESNASNVVQANYVRGDRLLAKKEVATGKSYYYLYNGHGDVIMMVDTNGNIVNQYQYDEWGNLLTNNETVKNSFKYAGEIYDEETGLYYLRARYYDPSIGRFINEDTYEGEVKNPLSLNLYTYVHNNPLIYSDPTGNWCTSSDGKYSHPGGCDGGTNYFNTKSNVNGSTWTPDADHVGEKEVKKGKMIGQPLYAEDLDMSDEPFNTMKEVKKNIATGAIDALAGKYFFDKLSDVKRVTIPMPTFGPAAKIEAVLPRPGITAIKGISKIAGIGALATTGYDVFVDFQEYDGNDALKAAAVDIAGTVIAGGGSILIGLAGAPVWVVVGGGIVVGVIVSWTASEIKDYVVNN